MKQRSPYTLLLSLTLATAVAAQPATALVQPAAVLAQPAPTGLWHGLERSVRYSPVGRDFVIMNGGRRFNRALYGTHTAFRVEAGDLPEFAMYLPGMGGNLQFGLLDGDSSKWLIRARSIRATYRPGSMIYEIKDRILGNGILTITALALADAEGMILRLRSSQTEKTVRLFCAFGGASGEKFSRDGEIGADPESSFYLQPANCTGNQYTIDRGRFHLSYGTGKALEGIFPPGALLKVADADRQGSPSEMLRSVGSATPALTASLSVDPGKDYYFLIRNVEFPANDRKTEEERFERYEIKNLKDSLEQPVSSTHQSPSLTGSPIALTMPPPGAYTNLPVVFEGAERARRQLADRVEVNTPDPYINTLGGALAIAADAIWEEPSYMHGAVAWRMRLNGWRGPYVADPLGWHDRARQHFSSYALSQVITPDSGPVVADTALRLARQEERMGTA